MQLNPGTKLAEYEITSAIGAGGMGEVYKARDTKLGREVAIKVLSEAFAQDKERLARFEREARLLASLNHPNIATIHDLEESEGVHFLVMELVPGETLAERIARGPIPLDEALPLFKQIAEGLEAAHEKGVIHRDLKPANVKVTPDGRIKILDFGLAKAFEGEPELSDLSQSPTITRDATRAGVILGTASYMSPEQARGKSVDKRTDIWAFGCCLYEALTGRKAFSGETVSDILASIIKTEPRWEALSAVASWRVQELLRLCLRKDPLHRLREIGDARVHIEDTLGEPESDLPAGILQDAKKRRAIPWPIAIVMTLLAGLLVWIIRSPSPPVRAPVTKLILDVKPAERLGGTGPDLPHRLSRTAIAFSPDGKQLVYSAEVEESPQLYLRNMDEMEATPIAGTEGGLAPFFSPDGQWLGFWAGGKLMKIPISGGPPQAICDVKLPPWGASWGSDDTIVFSQSGERGILRISADGGVPEEITTLEEGEWRHHLPHFLPGADAVLLTVRKGYGNGEDMTVMVQSLETGERKVLIENGADGRYAASGHLVFLRLGTLMAVAFDPNKLEISGSPVGVLASVQQDVNSQMSYSDIGAGQFSFSRTGSLVYVPGGIFPDWEGQLVWVARDGTAEPLPAPLGPYLLPRLSPDGRRVAVTKSGFEHDVWVYDILRETMRRFTLEEGIDTTGIWTPDGNRIAFASDRAGPERSIYWKSADGSGEVERLTTGRLSRPSSWSPDGKVLAYVYRKTVEDNDIWVLPVGGEAQPFIESPFNEANPEFAPNGRWLAYKSNESGRNEVYVTPYPGPGPKVQISTDGGFSPVWARNGREIFYRVSGDRRESTVVMAVDTTIEPTFSSGKPRVLFQGQYESTIYIRSYDVTPDGERFLLIKRDENDPVSRRVTHLNVVLNWFDELKQRVPVEN